MFGARQNLLTLCDALAAHQDVTHWALSKRLFGKGDFFHKLKVNPAKDIRSLTYEKAVTWFAREWPEDLEWPSDIPRPHPESKRSA